MYGREWKFIPRMIYLTGKNNHQESWKNPERVKTTRRWVVTATLWSIIIRRMFFISHPGRTKDHPAAKNSFDDRRSVIQLTELQYKDEEVFCDRNNVYIKLTADKKN